MSLAPEELQQSIQGLLAFPVTPVGRGGEVDLDAFRAQVRLLLTYRVGAVFPVGGTGEFFSLTFREYAAAVRACVAEVAGKVPVVPGIGYGAAMASEFARAAEEAGADGVLVLPPYLLIAEQDGLEAHYRAIASSTRLGNILYQRDNAVFQPETVRRLARVPNIIGLKDGLGQLERLQLIRDQVDSQSFLFMNGMPTAELHALAFGANGITTYSSAILNFLPEVATRFHSAVLAQETAVIHDLLHRAILPLSRIRSRRVGYAVSIVKAGARLRGLPVGQVRPPLTELTPTDERDLAALLVELHLDTPLVAQ